MNFTLTVKFVDASPNFIVTDSKNLRILSMSNPVPNVLLYREIVLADT